METAAFVVSLIAVGVSGAAAWYAREAPHKEATLIIEKEKRGDVRTHLTHGKEFMGRVSTIVELRGNHPIKWEDIPTGLPDFDLSEALELASELTNAPEVTPLMEEAYTAVLNVVTSWPTVRESLVMHSGEEETAREQRERWIEQHQNSRAPRWDTGCDAIDRQLDDLAQQVQRFDEASAKVREIFARADRGEGRGVRGWLKRRRSRNVV